MKVILKEVGEKFSGKFKAEFQEKETHKLFFDLDDWKSIADNGIFGGTYISIKIPQRMNLNFEQEYELDIETGRKIYETLYKHGWRDKEK